MVWERDAQDLILPYFLMHSVFDAKLATFVFRFLQLYKYIISCTMYFHTVTNFGSTVVDRNKDTHAAHSLSQRRSNGVVSRPDWPLTD